MAESLNPAALRPAELVKLLAKAGRKKITAARIASDLAAGAPTNRDGTIHLIHYTAWLAKRVV